MENEKKTDYELLIADVIKKLPKEDRMFAIRRVEELKKMDSGTLRARVKSMAKKEHKKLLEQAYNIIDNAPDTKEGKLSLVFLSVKHEKFKSDVNRQEKLISETKNK